MPRVSSVACLLVLLGLFTAHARSCQPPDCDHPDCGTCGELGSITHTHTELEREPAVAKFLFTASSCFFGTVAVDRNLHVLVCV